MTKCGCKSHTGKGKKGKKTVKKGGMLRVIAKGGSLASDMVMAMFLLKGQSLDTRSPRLKLLTHMVYLSL